MIIKEIEEIHWNGILEIQDKSYQEIGIEDLEVLKSKNEASPDTCFVCLSNKGEGIGRAAALKLFEVAQNKGIKSVILVAVQGAQSFWSIIGFQEVTGVNVCSSYGEKAILMEKILAA